MVYGRVEPGAGNIAAVEASPGAGNVVTVEESPGAGNIATVEASPGAGNIVTVETSTSPVSSTGSSESAEEVRRQQARQSRTCSLKPDIDMPDIAEDS